MFRFCIIFLTSVSLVGCSKEHPDKAVIALPTVICNECRQTITKAVMKLDGVQKITVDTEKKSALIQYVSTKVTVGELERAIVTSGYDANDLKRDPDSYERLPDCCKK